MIQKSFENIGGEKKIAYELAYYEFELVLNGLIMHAHPAEFALIKANDPRSRVRPRARVVMDDIAKLTEVVEDLDMPLQIPQPTDSDLLRTDFEEIRSAVLRNKSNLNAQKGHVYLGLYTLAKAFDTLRVPLVTATHQDAKTSSILDMMNQFYADGVERIAETV